jgi:uncharacterized protein (TIGR03086 family)
MDLKALFKTSITQAGMAIKKARLDQCDLATPCTDWDLNDLVGHMLYEIAWVPELLEGRTVAEIGDRYEGGLGGDNPAALWDEYAEKALAAIEKADAEATVHLSYGDVKASHYINEIGGNTMIHTWDVCQSLSHNLWFEAGIAQSVYDFVSPRASEFASSGLFGTPVTVAADAPIQLRLLGFLGRTPQAEPDTDPI